MNSLRKIFSFFNTIKVRIIAFNTLLIIIPVLILGYYGYQHLTDQLQSDTSKLVKSNLENISLNVDNLLSNIEAIALRKSKDQPFINNINAFINSGDTNKPAYLSNLSIDLIQTSLENSIIDSMYLLSKRDKVIITSEKGYKLMSYQDDISYSSINTIGWHLNESIEDCNKRIISYYRPIDSENSIFLNINTSDFDIVVNRDNLVENGILLYMIDGNGSLIYSTNEQNYKDLYKDIDTLEGHGWQFSR